MPADGFRPFAYVLSKRCLNAFVAKKMVHFADKSIRINAVLPASTETGLAKRIFADGGLRGKFRKTSRNRRRLARSQEMAGPLVFINSDMASFITGDWLKVDLGDGTLKLLKQKKDLQNIPVALKLYNAEPVKRLMQRYIDKG